MIGLIVSAYAFHILISIIAGIGESYRIIDPVIHSKTWHEFQWIERIGLYVTGMAVGLIIGVHWLLALVALTMGVIFFILYDGMINRIVYERNFFYVSETTTAWTEKFAHWWIKVPLMIGLAILNVLLLRKLKKEE